MVLDFKPADCQCDRNPVLKTTFKATFRAAKDGELFIYVNDSIVVWRGLKRYYENNKGEAQLKIAPVP
jgi:hypothetical protein